jgi:hypothetical protein
LAPQGHVEFRSVEEGGILVDLESGACFQLNRVGADLWKSLSGGATVGAAIDSLRSRYDVASEVLERDSLLLCDELLRVGLIAHRSATTD